MIWSVLRIGVPSTGKGVGKSRRCPASPVCLLADGVRTPTQTAQVYEFAAQGVLDPNGTATRHPSCSIGFRVFPFKSTHSG